MLNAIATLLGLKHSLVTGLAIVALLLVFGPQLKQMGNAQQTQQVQQAQQVQQEQELPQQQQATEALQTLPQEQVQEHEQNNSLQENLKIFELDEKGFNWNRDWWKYVLMALSVVIVAYLTLKVTNMLFRTAIVMLCIALGLVGSLLLTPVVTPFLASFLEGKLPDFLAPIYIAYALCFLVCYLIATAITNAVGRPGKSKNNTKADDDSK